MAKNKERTCVNCNKVVTYSYGTKPSVCPYCGNKWWDKPKDEYDLQMLQDDYIRSGRDPNKLSLMYDGLIRYCENLIKKNLKGKKNLDPERIYEQAEDSALNFLEVYLKKPDYVVEASFGGLLSRYVAGVMYNNREKLNDSLTSLDSIIADDMKLEDNVYKFMDTSSDKDKFEKDAYSEYMQSHPEELLDDLISIIVKKKTQIEKSVNQTDRFLFLVAIRNFLLKNRRCSIDEFYDYYGDDLKFDIDDCLEKMKRRLKDER